VRGSTTLTCQDWYRVRRGEDEIAWGLCRWLGDAAKMCFSRRASQEFAFLEPGQKRSVMERLRDVCAHPYGEQSRFVLRGGGRWATQVGDMRVVYQVDPGTGAILVSTIRGGKVLDPEAVGPTPK